jgi:GntR family transcriptional regulator, histidine utilization repressor
MTPGAAPPTAAVPAWRRVHAELLRRIRDGEWPGGTRLPAEPALAAELGVSRHTLHRAMRELAEAGVLARRRRAGTRVAVHPVRQMRVAIPLLRQEIVDRGARPGYRLLSRRLRPAPPGVAAVLGVPAGTTLTRVRALHTADGRPFVFEDRWVDGRVVPGFETADLTRVSANEWLLARVPLGTGRVRIAAEGCGPRVAALLGCAPGAPLLVMRRVTHRDGVGITAVRLMYAPGYEVRTSL